MPDHTLSMVGRDYTVAGDEVVQLGLLVLFMAMSLVLYRSRHMLMVHLREFFSSRRQYRQVGTGNVSSEPYNVFVLTSVAALTFTLVFFNYASQRYGFSPVLGVPYWLFAAGYVAVLLFIYAKVVIYAVVNWVFYTPEQSRQWLRGYLLATSMLAYFCYPFSLLSLFSDFNQQIVIWCFVFVSFLYESVLLFKLFVNFRGKNYGIMLIFLYFCSVELIPTLIIWHFVAHVSGNFIEANVLY